MKNKLLFFTQFLIFGSFTLLVFSPVAKAQSIEPDAQIVREMVAYAAKVEKAAEQSRPRAANRKNPNALNNAKNRTPVAENNGRSAPFYALERKAFDILNEKRVSRGLQPLRWNEDMARVARIHSENMARYKFFSHTGLDGSLVNDRAKRLVDRTWYSIGENIAFNKGFKLPVESACQQWMNSPGHKENLLDPHWNATGIGAAFAPDGSFYITQVFIN